MTRKNKILTKSMCTALATLMLMPQVNCFATEVQKKQISNVSENKIKNSNETLKEIKSKLKKLSLSEWLEIAGAIGISVTAAIILWKKYHKSEPKPISNQIKDETIEKLNEFFDKPLPNEELSQLEQKLKSEDISSNENLETLKINREKLQSLEGHVLNSENDIDNICNALENFYLNNENMYDPQKRFVLSYIIYEASKIAADGTNKNIYDKLFEVNEKVNQKVICNALKNDKNPIEARKTIANLLFLEHLGVLEFNYHKENEVKRTPTPSKEYTSSSLAYGETVVLTLPHGSGEKIFNKIFVDSNKEKTWGNRTSTHSFEVENNANNGIRFTEKKGDIIDAAINFLGHQIGLINSQKGINLNVCSNDKTANVDGTSGHILVGTAELALASGALIKLESAAPCETSKFGHTHGMSGKSNIISATCQFRPFSPHEKRSGILVNVSGLTVDELNQALDAFNENLEANLNDDEFLKKLTGLKMTENELKEFLNKLAEDGQNKQQNSDIIQHAKQPLRFYENSENMKALSNSVEDTGLMIFYDPQNGKYKYYVANETQFNGCFKNEHERNLIKANQLELLSLNASYMQLKDASTISNISKTLEEYINKNKQNNKILDIQHFEIFEKRIKEKEFIKGIETQKRRAQDKAYRIPGVEIYRNDEGKVGTCYGYYIENVEKFKQYCGNNNISDEDAKKIYACQNWWFYTSNEILDGDRWNILENKNIPEVFRKHIELIKKYHTLNDYGSGFVSHKKFIKDNNQGLLGDFTSLLTGNQEWRIFNNGKKFEEIKGNAKTFALGIDANVFDSKKHDSIEEILRVAGINK